MRSLIFLFICLSASALSQQMSAGYKKQIQLADSLFSQQQYGPAASAYSIAFRQNNNKGLVEDRYHAATGYALSNNADSAFYNLFRLAGKAGWNNYDKLITDSNLVSLHNDTRWGRLVNKVRSNKAETDVQSKNNHP
jgi:hypothetical protein